MVGKKRGELETDDGFSVSEQTLGGRKASWAKFADPGRIDSLILEAGRVSKAHRPNSKVQWTRTLSLAFQSIGIIYGDIGTSPLYVYASTFTDGIHDNDDILGVLSLIIYTFALVPLLKYIFIVLWANDNGDGGTFALYSLICRHAKVSMIPNEQPEDKELSHYQLEIPTNRLKRAEMVKQKLESSRAIQIVLFLVTILGTSMVIGDGVLTPSISVLSAVSGIGSLGTGAVVGISVVILVGLFSVQRFGTDKVGFSFAPIISVWFLFLSGIGLYNLFKHDIGVLRAFYPKYIIDYFRRNGMKGWISLGGVFLCITGTEAMFADLGHFSVRAVQISFTTMACPALITAYIGQAAFLRKFPNEVDNTFYASIPGAMYWPTFVVAVGAAIIASQAMISGAFAIVSQSLSLGCFPRVKVVHTSAKYEGQVYIPEINYVLMIACVLVTLGFRSTDSIGHAYGIAVVCVMVITTCMVTIIMLIIWKTNIWLIVAFFVIFIIIDGIYLSAVLYKFTHGGYLPLLFSLFLMILMAIWHYVHKERYMYELKNKVSPDFVRDLVKNPSVNRIPGVGLLYSGLVQGIPPIFPHYVNNIPSIHSVFVFVSIKSILMSRVELEERFLFRQVEPRECRMFRCVARFGYNDDIRDSAEFERQLVERLKEFILLQYAADYDGGDSEQANDGVNNIQHSTLLVRDPRGHGSSRRSAVHIEESLQQQDADRVSSGSIRVTNMGRSENRIQGAEEEAEFVQNAMEKGVIYLLGETRVRAKEDSSLLKKFVVDYAYDFLRRNFRQGDEAMGIPRGRLLRVGMTYEI